MNAHLARILVASVALLVGSAAHAQAQYGGYSQTGFTQGQSLVILNWEPSKPVAGFHDYVEDWSLRGFSVDMRNKFHPKASAGLSFSWNRWNQTFDDLSANIANGVISGPVYRYADMFAIRALAHYYLMDGPIQPYVGFGIGGAWAYGFQQVADLQRSQNGFHFIVSPEAGVLVQLLGGRTGLNANLAFRYTYTTAGVGQPSKDIQTITPVVGLAWNY